MNGFKKFLVKFLVVVFALSTFTSVFVPNKPVMAAKKVTVTWMNWANPGERERFVKFNQDFMKKNPDIELKYITVSSDYGPKLLTQLASNTAPDAFYIGDTDIRKAIHSGKLEVLDKYFGTGKVNLKKEDFNSVLFRVAEKDGKTYGIPVDCNPMAIYYNNTIIKKLGFESPKALYDKGQWTWDNFYKIAKAAKAKGYYGFVLDSGWFGPVLPWFAAAKKDGSEPILTDYATKTYKINNPDNVEAVKFLVKGIKDKAFVYGGSLPQGQGSDAMFLTGRLAFGAWGRWQVPNFKKVKSFEWDVVPYPTKYGNKDAKTYIAQAWMSMSSSAKNKEATWRFIAAFNNKDGQYFRLQGQGNAVPSIRGIDKIVTEDKVPAFAEIFLKGRENGFPVDMYPGEVSVQTQVLQDLEKIWVLQADPVVQLNKIAKYVTDTYKKSLK
ncbi:sugar ABC transporter substrate-binding protein [Caldicellulosiruptoraceae bacterium PP1]